MSSRLMAGTVSELDQTRKEKSQLECIPGQDMSVFWHEGVGSCAHSTNTL